MKKFGVLLTVVLLGTAIFLPMETSSAVDYNKSFSDVSGDVGISDIDILSMTTEDKGDQLVLKLEVSGNIKQSSQDGTYSYQFYLTDEQSQYTSNYVVITFTQGQATYTSMIGSSGSSGMADYSIDGGELTLKIPLSVVENLDAFYLWASATYSNSDTGEESIDWFYSWKSSGGGSDGGDGTGFEDVYLEDDTKPSTVSPTDTSVSVSISSIDLRYENTSDGVEMEITMKGTTSGCDHVGFSVTEIYKNGTEDYMGGWYLGPFDWSDTQIFTIEVKDWYFKSVDGDNWEDWEYKMHIVTPPSDEGSTETAEDMAEIDKVRVYARAYTDQNNEDFNQANKELGLERTDGGDVLTSDPGDEDGDGAPGFGFAVMISTVFIMAAIYRKKNISE